MLPDHIGLQWLWYSIENHTEGAKSIIKGLKFISDHVYSPLIAQLEKPEEALERCAAASTTRHIHGSLLSRSLA